MVHIRIPFLNSPHGEEDDPNKQSPKQLKEKAIEALKDDPVSRTEEDENAIKEQLDESEKEVASLKQTLQELRDETDQDYAIALTFAAKEKGELNQRLKELKKERDRLVACNILQQVHIDTLTEEEKHQLQRIQPPPFPMVEEESMDSEHLQSIQTALNEFKDFLQIWVKSHRTSSRAAMEQLQEDSRDDNEEAEDLEDEIIELEIAFKSFQNAVSKREHLEKVFCPLDTIEEEEEEEEEQDAELHGSPSPTTFREHYEKTVSSNSGHKQASNLKQVVYKPSFGKPWSLFGLLNQGNRDCNELDLNEQFRHMREEARNDLKVALRISKEEEQQTNKSDYTQELSKWQEKSKIM